MRLVGKKKKTFLCIHLLSETASILFFLFSEERREFLSVGDLWGHGGRIIEMGMILIL